VTVLPLDQILMLTGRLDESAGFDSARERFRRFLLDHVREPAMARVLIDECQHAPGDEHRRALQDLVVLLGRFLGFHARFAAGARHAEWQSRGVHVLVDVRADSTDDADLTAFSQAVAAAAAAPSAAGVRVIGVSVVTPMSAGRAALDSPSLPADAPVAVVALSALLSVTALAAAGRASHDDVVRLLTSSAPLGFVLALLERCADDRALLSSGAPRGRVNSTGFWILRLAGARGTTPEEFLEVVVGRRHLLGLAGDQAVNDAVQTGDRICFSIEGRGVVGHGRVVPLESGQPTLREAHRFRHVWALDELRVYLAAPMAVDVETELRLRAAGDPGRDGQTMVSISRESFDAMTSPPREGASAPDAAGSPRLAG
jgi:hypothetical protein